MIIVMRKTATRADTDRILERIAALGLQPLYLPGEEKIVLGAIGDERVLVRLQLDADPNVERVIPILAPYKLVSRESQPVPTTVRVGTVAVGGPEPVVMAGPCAVEGEDQILRTARAVREAGAHVLRGGAYKPRTSPYSFQGLERDGLRLLARAREETGLPVVTEVLDPGDIPVVMEHADLLQVGARNMQNFRLLRELGRIRKPVLLKRGMSATVEEWLMSAEYVLSGGNRDVILCERGIKTFSTSTRNTLDLSVVPLIRELSHLPVIVDPSHATGIRSLVPPMSLAALSAGAHGLLIEVHVEPDKAQCDGRQQLSPGQFRALMDDVRRLRGALARGAGS